MPLQIRTIISFESVQAISEQWKALLDDQESPSVALTPEWIFTWWKAHNHRNKWQIFFFAAFDNSQLVGLFPFFRIRDTYRGLPVTMLRLPVDGITPHGDFLIAPELRDAAIRPILAELLRQENDWDVVILEKFRDNPNRTSLIEFLNRSRLLYGIQDSLKTPVVKADVPWEVFWCMRPKKFRRSLKNKLNRARKAGSISIERIISPNDLARALGLIYEVSSQSWKGAIGRSLRDNPIEHAFYEKFTRVAGTKGWVQIWLMNYSNTPIAYEYHVVHQGIVYPLRADYHSAYKSLSPGSLLEYNIIKAMFDGNEGHTYYSCANDYEYLLNWTSQLEELKRIEIFNSRPLSRLAYTLEYRVIPRLRKFRTLRKIKDVLIKRSPYAR